MQFRILGAATVVSSVIGLRIYSEFDEGLKRSFLFWSDAAPIYAHYRFTQLRIHWMNLDDEKAEKEWSRLHEKYSPIAERGTFKMRGYYLKQAQIMSLRSDYIPEQYLKWMRKTQNEVPTQLAVGEWREIVVKELGKEMSEVFEWWDDKPLGIASIGEVHRARTLTGREVVIKVQGPGVEDRFRNDIKNGKRFCKLALPQHLPAMIEIEKQFDTEFDYLGEARNMQLIHDNLMPHWSDRLCIPEPLMHLCTKKVLVMDYLPGRRLDDVFNDSIQSYAGDQGMTVEELKNQYIHRINKDKHSKVSDLHKVSQQIKTIQSQYYVKDWIFSLNSLRYLYNKGCQMMHSWGHFPSLEYQQSPMPHNVGETLLLLIDVHGYQIFQNGVFHADPHPGNVLVMPDGRVGLIDFGQVKHLDIRERVAYAKLIIALVEQDEEAVIRILCDEIGVRTEHADRSDVLFKWCLFWHDRDTSDVTGGKNIGEFIQWCKSQNHVEYLPPVMIMTSRVSTMMRGQGLACGFRLSTATYWEPFANQLLSTTAKQTKN